MLINLVNTSFKALCPNAMLKHGMRAETEKTIDWFPDATPIGGRYIIENIKPPAQNDKEVRRMVINITYYTISECTP
jgi:hypothetical protein